MHPLPIVSEYCDLPLVFCPQGGGEPELLSSFRSDPKCSCTESYYLTPLAAITDTFSDIKEQCNCIRVYCKLLQSIRPLEEKCYKLTHLKQPFKCLEGSFSGPKLTCLPPKLFGQSDSAKWLCNQSSLFVRNNSKRMICFPFLQNKYIYTLYVYSRFSYILRLYIFDQQIPLKMTQTCIILSNNSSDLS